MPGAAPSCVRRLFLVTPEPWTAGAPCDYADAFELQLGAPDDRSAEQWARCALEQAPRAVRMVVRVAQRRVLGLRLEPQPDAQHVLGWRVVASEPDVIALTSDGALLRAVIVGRRVGATAVQIKTFVRFERLLGRFAWTLVAPLHRGVARLLLRRAAMTAHDG